MTRRPPAALRGGGRAAGVLPRVRPAPPAGATARAGARRGASLRVPLLAAARARRRRARPSRSALTWESRRTGEAVITATGGSLTDRRLRRSPQRRFADVARRTRRLDDRARLVPKGKGGRDAALARAQQAARAACRASASRLGAIASLHPGYWVVFTGVYDTEPEATSALLRARAGRPHRDDAAHATDVRRSLSSLTRFVPSL